MYTEHLMNLSLTCKHRIQNLFFNFKKCISIEGNNKNILRLLKIFCSRAGPVSFPSFHIAAVICAVCVCMHAFMCFHTNVCNIVYYYEVSASGLTYC